MINWSSSSIFSTTLRKLPNWAKICPLIGLNKIASVSGFARYRPIDFLIPGSLFSTRWVVSVTTFLHCSMVTVVADTSTVARKAWIGDDNIVAAVVMKSVQA